MANLSSNPSSQVLSPEAQRQQDLQVAQAAFQAASLRKDTDPLTYEYTRYNYYSKLYGPDWANQEKARIASSQLDPIVQKYRNQYNSIEAEYSGQKDISDAVKTLNQQQTQVKSTIEKQLEYIGDSIDEKQNKINVFKRYIELEGGHHRPSTSSSRATDKLADYFGQFPESFFVAISVLNALLLFLLGLIYYKKIVASITEFTNRLSVSGGVGSGDMLEQIRGVIREELGPRTRTPIGIPGSSPPQSTGYIKSGLTWIWESIKWLFLSFWIIVKYLIGSNWKTALVILSNITVVIFIIIGFVTASKK